MYYFDIATWTRLAGLVMREPSRGKRKCLAIGLFIGLSVLALISTLALAIDALFLRGWRRVEPRAPIFIIGNGRSGTTHMHRLLTADEGQFCFFRTWELLLPSVVQKKAVHLLARFDEHLLGGALQRRLRAREDEALAEVRKLHDWQSTGSEEDDFIFFHNFSSVSLTWPFPYPELGYLFDTDALPEARRRRIMGWYRDMVKRQLYLHGPERVHCAKSPQFTLKMRALAETFPGARFIVMVRHPCETIPSLIDLMSWYWRKMDAPAELIESSATLLREKMIQQYRYAIDVADSLPADRSIILRFEDLLVDPKAAVDQVYQRFGLPMSPAFERYLEGEREHARNFRSAHVYEPLQDAALRARLHAELGDLFERFGWERGEAVTTDGV